MPILQMQNVATYSVVKHCENNKKIDGELFRNMGEILKSKLH